MVEIIGKVFFVCFVIAQTNNKTNKKNWWETKLLLSAPIN